MDKINAIIGLTAYTSEGNAYSVKDFINTPRVGYMIEQVDDIGFKAIPAGEAVECVSGVCPKK
jgi:hypothetical protein